MRRAVAVVLVVTTACQGRPGSTVGAWRWDDGPAGLSQPAPPEGVRGGDLVGPRALAADVDRVLVLDPAGARVTSVPLDHPKDWSVLVEAPFLAAATDLALAADGALWVAGADCGCLRRWADGAWTAVPLAEELLGLPIRPVDSSTVAVGAPDDHRLWVVWRGELLTPDEQRIDQLQGVSADHFRVASLWGGPGAVAGPEGPIGVDEAWAVRVEAHGESPARLPLPGAPIAIEAMGGACDDTHVLVAQSARGDHVTDTVFRYDADGVVLDTVSGDAPAPFFVPSRRFSVSAEGRVFQLRPEEKHLALVEWSTGCP